MNIAGSNAVGVCYTSVSRQFAHQLKLITRADIKHGRTRPGLFIEPLFQISREQYQATQWLYYAFVKGNITVPKLTATFMVRRAGKRQRRVRGIDDVNF